MLVAVSATDFWPSSDNLQKFISDVSLFDLLTIESSSEIVAQLAEFTALLYSIR